jgi:hypothetical protein
LTALPASELLHHLFLYAFPLVNFILFSSILVSAFKNNPEHPNLQYTWNSYRKCWKYTREQTR